MRIRLLVLALFGFPLFASLGTTADPDADPFAEGTVWAGDFKVAVKDSQVQKWVLTVTERKGGSLKGEILARNSAGEVEATKVEGTATAKSGGAVALKSEKKGFGQVLLRGKLANGEVVLVFSGTNKFGKPGAGVATLKPKN